MFYLSSFFHVFLLLQLAHRRTKDNISYLFSFMSFIAVWLEVLLVLLTFDKVYSIVLYNLLCPELQPQCFGFSIVQFTFAADLLMLVPNFVKVLRSDFLKVRSTFFR
jgi:hypothetical protein